MNFLDYCYRYRYLLSPFRHSPSWHSIVLLQLSFYLFTTALVVLDDHHPNIRQCIPGWEELNNTRVIIISTLKSENLPQYLKSLYQEWDILLHKLFYSCICGRIVKTVNSVVQEHPWAAFSVRNMAHRPFLLYSTC